MLLLVVLASARGSFGAVCLPPGNGDLQHCMHPTSGNNSLLQTREHNNMVDATCFKFVDWLKQMIILSLPHPTSSSHYMECHDCQNDAE